MPIINTDYSMLLSCLSSKASSAFSVPKLLNELFSRFFSLSTSYLYLMPLGLTGLHSFNLSDMDEDVGAPYISIYYINTYVFCIYICDIVSVIARQACYSW